MTNPWPGTSQPLEVVQLLSYLWKSTLVYTKTANNLKSYQNVKAVQFQQLLYHKCIFLLSKYSLNLLDKIIFLSKSFLASLLSSYHCPDILGIRDKRDKRDKLFLSLYLSIHIYMHGRNLCIFQSYYIL